MAKKADTLNREDERRPAAEGLTLKDALQALRRLRKIGEKLPEADAAAVVRESRDSAGLDSR